MTDSVPMDLVGIRIELPTNTPILLLREHGGERYLPIWINTPEATAIALAHDGIKPERPLTHDLLTTLIEELAEASYLILVTLIADVDPRLIEEFPGRKERCVGAYGDSDRV